MFDELRDKIDDDIFDHTLLFSVLKEYSKPRDKITRLLNKNEIIQVKRGLYVFGKKWRRGPVQKEILANLIYGPSYVSMEYALSLYGMIPEKVETVSSMTIKRIKFFNTPFGRFEYYPQTSRQYSIGIDLFTINSKQHFFIASREKALADLVARQKNIADEDEMWDHLIENLRIDEECLASLNHEQLEKISHAYCKKNVYLLENSIRKKTK